MRGARRGGLLDGAAAAAGPHLLVQAEAELSAALAVRSAEAAIQCAWGRGYLLSTVLSPRIIQYVAFVLFSIEYIVK